MIKKLISLLTVLLCATPSAWAQVGMREVMSQDMHITLIYPTSQISTTQQRGPFEIEVALNAPLSAKARHLIVLSHGTGGNAWVDHALASTLARAGFVVAQPEHRGDNARDYSKAGPESWLTRPLEISETIDWVAQDPQWGKQLDLQHVGVHGMSAGGVSALVMAGGQWRMLDMVQHCGQHLDEDGGFCMNGLANQPLKQALRKARYTLGMNTSEQWLPDNVKALHGAPSPSTTSPNPRPDTRVAAVSALVPLAAIFTPESLSRIAIPLGVTTAGKDEVLLPKFHAERLLANCSRCTLLSAHPQAGHFDWLWPWPSELAQKIAALQIRGGMPHADFTAAQRQSGFDRIAAFFKTNLEP